MTVIEKVQKALRLDGWTNILTSIGIKGKDKRMTAEVEWERGNRDSFDHFYAADDIAGNIVDCVPDDAFTKGYKLKGVEDQKLLEKIMDRGRQLKLDDRVLEAWKLARIHGGSGIIKVSEDAKMELPMPALKKLLALNVVDRWDLMVNSIDIDGQITSPTFREALKFHLQVSEGADSTFIPIHGSRVVKFDGAYLPRRLMRTNQYWGDSILSKIYNAIRNYQISHDAAALTIQDFDIPVLKLKNLAELMTTNCDDAVIKRLEMVNLSKSVAKMIVLDADKEEFEHKSRSVTGLHEILAKVEDRLVAAAKIPRTKLFGESAGGLGSTGESQATDWYDYIQSQQTNYLKPKMLEIYRHIIRTEFLNVDAESIDIEFNPLWQMSDKEMADMRKVQAETDQIYITQQVLDSTEVALSRFGGEKYSTETIIDKELREQTPIDPKESLMPEPPPEKVVETPPLEKVTKFERSDEDLKAIQELNDKVKLLINETKKEVALHEDYEYVFKKDQAFETELDLKASTGEPLPLEGYTFRGFFKRKQLDADNICTFDVHKTNVEGQIRLTIKPETINALLKTHMDSEQDMECYLGVQMKRPNGTIKRIKLAKAIVNV